MGKNAIFDDFMYQSENGHNSANFCLNGSPVVILDMYLWLLWRNNSGCIAFFRICLVNFHALDKRISENSYFLKIRKFSQFADGCRSQPSVFPLRICRIFLLLPGFDWGLLWYVWVNYSKILRNHNVWSQTAEPCSGFFFAPEFCSGVFYGVLGKTRMYRNFPRNFAFAMCQVLHLICLVVPAVGLICSYHMQLLTLRICSWIYYRVYTWGCSMWHIWCRSTKASNSGTRMLEPHCGAISSGFFCAPEHFTGFEEKHDF